MPCQISKSVLYGFHPIGSAPGGERKFAALEARTIGRANSCSIYAASLDDPSLIKPERVIFTSAAQPWDTVEPGLAKRRLGIISKIGGGRCHDGYELAVWTHT